MSTYAMLQMLAYLALDGTLAATYAHLRENATPTVSHRHRILEPLH
jgi:hypothetical protein